MRAVLLFALLVTACAQAADDPPATVRDRLSREEAALAVAPAASGGSITAQRRISSGWQAAIVPLTVRAGELVAAANERGAITIERIVVDLGPIEIPRSVFGYPAQLTGVHLASKRPVEVRTAWTGDDAASATAAIDLALTWSLTVDGQTTPLGAPPLPPLPISIELVGDGATIHADAHAIAAGVVWSWAELVKLEDLTLTLAATTGTP